MKKIALLSLLTSSLLVAGGYKVPENSLNAVALSAANVAHSIGAESAYSSPANMIFQENRNLLEVDVTYIGLSPVTFEGSVNPSKSKQIVYQADEKYQSKSEDFLLPSLFYVSPELADRFRLGLSVVVPAGLSKRWDDGASKFYAQEYTLQIVEVNPTIAMKVTDTFSVAVGVRVLKTSGVIDGSGDDLDATASAANTTSATLKRTMIGDAIDYGYNVALAYHPTKAIDLAATFRSNVDLSVEGEASVAKGAPQEVINSNNAVSVPVPATIVISGAYTFKSETTVEFAYERTLWSSYKTLDFKYENDELEGLLGKPIPKDWKDTNTYRLGLTQKYDKVTAMAGVIYDESPIPTQTLNFETPDSNALSFSLGGRYHINKDISVGLAGLYSIRDEITLDETSNNTGINGTFKDSRVYIISTGIEYKF